MESNLERFRSPTALGLLAVAYPVWPADKAWFLASTIDDYANPTVLIRATMGGSYGRGPPMTDWITDRLPTEADADTDGDVVVNDGYLLWNKVQLGRPWRHSGYYEDVDVQVFDTESIKANRTKDWIITRQPLASDGNKDGAVHVRKYPDREWGVNIHWSYVGIGVPWQHTNDFEGVVEPIPSGYIDKAIPPESDIEGQPDDVGRSRTFVSVQRTYVKHAKAHFLDAIASDGTAWWRYSDENAVDTHWIRCRDLPQS